jgi:hypothetical protein
MLNKIYKIGFVASFVASPLFANAFLEGTRTRLESVQEIVKTLIIPIIFTLALLCFFWGIVKYIWSEGQGKEEGRKIMIWGIVALFVMASVWGLVGFVQNSIGIDAGTTPTIPTIN